VAAPLTRYWWLRTKYPEGRDWFVTLLDALDDPPAALAAQSLTGLGFLQLASGDAEGAVGSLEAAVRRWRDADQPDGLPTSLHYLARAAWGIYPADRVLELVNEAAVTVDRDARPSDAFIIHMLATLWYCEHDEAEPAARAAELTWTYAERSAAPNNLAHGNEALALAALARGQPDSATRPLQEALGIYRQLGNLGCAAHCLEFTAWQRAQTGHIAQALDLLAAASDARARHRAPIPAYELIGRTKTLIRLNVLETAIPPVGADTTIDTAIDTAIHDLALELEPPSSRRS
jgi:tetratricopeptide (TPR) repeat protein